jgi:hypothetical protein
MALKIDVNQSATAFHVNDGAQLFPYAIDAQHAISSHPLEWSATPWSREDADAARKALRERYEQDVENAKARNLPMPAPPPPDPEPMTDEARAAIEEHNQAVAAAAERLNAYRAKKAAENAELAQVAADEAIVASLPPAPDPNIRRPFGRKGPPTPAEIAAAQKQADKKAADDKLVADKANEDKLAASNAKQTT